MVETCEVETENLKQTGTLEHVLRIENSARARSIPGRDAKGRVTSGKKWGLG